MDKYCPQQGLPELGDVFVAEALSQVSKSKKEHNSTF